MSTKAGQNPGHLPDLAFEVVPVPLPAAHDRDPMSAIEFIDIPYDEAWDLFVKSEIQQERMCRYADTVPAPLR